MRERLLAPPMVGDDVSHKNLSLADHVQSHSLRNLTPDERSSLDHQQEFLEKHRGHEQMHSSMLLIFVASIIVAQLLLMGWRRIHPKSFNLATLFGLWLIPPFIALRAGNTRFLIIWSIFSLLNGFVVAKGMAKPLASWVPKVVYKWYSVVYQVSYGVGLLGYGLILVCFFGVLRLLFAIDDEQDTLLFKAGIIILFYGLYFGVLGRDIVVSLSDEMAVNMGYYGGQRGFPSKHLRDHVCAICGDTTDDSIKAQGIKVTSLDCKHSFHDSCLRGWCIVGKKDMCPYCKEKVDLKGFRSNPWDTSQHLYLALLDGLRHILVWQPIILLLPHMLINFLGYD